MWKRGKTSRRETTGLKLFIWRIVVVDGRKDAKHNRPLYFTRLGGHSSAAIVWINQTFIFLMVLFCQNSKNLKTIFYPYAKEATNQPDSYKVNRNGFFPCKLLVSTIFIPQWAKTNCRKNDWLSRSTSIYPTNWIWY